MSSPRPAHLITFVVALGVVAPSALTGSPVPAQAEEPLPEISAPSRVVVEGPAVEDLVRFEVRENDLLLTNISDRPINAWMIKTVVRSSQGYEAYTIRGIEAYRSSRQPGGGEGLLEPGESVAIEKPQKPWLREDHRGPGSGVYYEVGAITFEGGEAAGDPEVIDRLFADRLTQARDALRAIDATAGERAGDADLEALLPEEYRGLLERFADRQEAIRAIQRTAWDDYHAALANLRPEDLVELPTPQEVVR